jgi:hypothetical protein
VSKSDKLAVMNTIRPLFLLLLAGCAAAPERPPPREPEPARARAALATVYVENETAERLTVAYRVAGRPAEVIIGQVPPGERAALAPVPAGEPLLLVARTAAGAILDLPVRAFAIDAEWTWHIPADAEFQPPQESRR